MYWEKWKLICEKELQNVTANVKAKIPDNVYIHFDTFVYHRLFFTAAAVCFVSKDVPHSKPFELKTKFGKSYKKTHTNEEHIQAYKKPFSSLKVI